LNLKSSIVFFSILFFVCLKTTGQSVDVEKEIFRYHQNKNIHWANKQVPEEVEILYLNNYNDSEFPNEDILKFKNLKHLIVEARPLVLKINGEIHDPVEIKINEESLTQLHHLEYLQLSRFDFRTFPIGLTKMERLKGLSLSSCIIKDIPEEISNLKNLEGLFLRQNDLEDLPLEIANLNRLKVLDLCNNSFNSIPPSVLKIPNIETVYLANYNGVRTDPFSWDWPVNLNVNLIDYPNEINNLKDLLSTPSMKKIHLHVNNSSIKKASKLKLANKILAKKILWQSIDCGCGS
jgi:Leucine-rich repeat (LRR) protein